MLVRFFDAHCDTGSECMTKGSMLKENSFHLDIDRMGQYDGYIQVFAAFVDKKIISSPPLDHCLSVLKYLREQLKKNQGVISMITTETELRKVVESGGLGAILSIEGGEALNGNINNLYMFYKIGVRLITLTWNYSNEIGDGILEEKHGGLTEFGRMTVSAMEDLGIVIDVSHLSQQGFWDVVKHTKHPFVASHSNARAICNHPRNLSDEQIRCIANRNGCIGLNFYPLFLTYSEKAEMNDVLQHMEYIFRIAGEDCIGIGSDFDGISCLPNDITGVESMGDFFSVLKKRGYSDSFIDKLCFGNFYRIFSETLRRRT